MKQLYVILAFAACWSCTGKGGQTATSPKSASTAADVNAEFYIGEFSYLADAALFLDCTTGQKYSVLMQDAYLQTEQTYVALQPVNGAPVVCELKGYLKPKPEGEEGWGMQLVVTQLIGFDKDFTCIAGQQLPGLYACSEMQGETVEKKHLLTLKGDYSWELTTQSVKEQVEVTVYGQWHLTSRANLVLVEAEGSEAYLSGTVDYDRMTLIMERDKVKIFVRQHQLPF